MTPEAATRPFATVIEQCAPPLHRAALRATGDAHAADEIVAETLARAWEHRARFVPRGEGSLEAWLHGIAANVTGHWHRERTAQLSATRRLASRERGVTEDPASEIIDRTDAVRLRERFSRASEVLTGDQRQAVAMRVLDDATYEEIAAATGATTATARARVSRGLRTLALIVGVSALLLVATAAASAAISAIAELVWPREQPAQVPTAADVAAWDPLPIEGMITSTGAMFSATIRDMATGEVRPAAAGRGRILHPAVGTYLVEIPALSSDVSDVIPSMDMQVYDHATSADLTLPDPVTGARLAVAPDAPEVVRRGSAAVVRLPIHVRRFGEVGAAGMRCMRARYKARHPNADDPMATRSALLGSVNDCRMVPGVMPEIDIGATKRFGDGSDVLDERAGTPVDLPAGAELAVNVSITELGAATPT